MKPNSPSQGGASFPQISIGDMVESQYRLVTEVLGLDGLHAVSGASMGGMQTFEWMVSHPDFFAKAAPLIGSPKLGPYDIALWETQLRILALYDACGCEDAAAALAGVGMLTGSSPSFHQRQTDRSTVEASMETSAASTLERRAGWTHDMARQLQAMIDHDVTRLFGGDMAAAAAATRAELLNIVVGSDHVVTPWTAIEFAELAGGESMVIGNDCGHGGLFCADADYVPTLQAFLKRD